MSKESVITKIKSDWGEQPQSDICIAVLNYLVQSTMELSHITYGSIGKIVGQDFSDREVISSIEYLCGDSVRLLEIGFELIENDDYIPISKSEMRIARETGKLLHPEQGVLLENYEENVFLYFYPSELIKEIRS
ncbi:MAG: hypothetical protein ACFB0G_12635 [Leptolyngbyaceae cyanobacterium]